jgi:hypothetical protein
MNTKHDDFFDEINFRSILDCIKSLYMSDNAMATLLDFERCLDDADLYAFKNWLFGELVNGPQITRYQVSCTFMWPSDLMPDPKGAKRLIQIGCKVRFYKTKIKMPVEIKSNDDYMPGTHYPRLVNRNVWMVDIAMPKDLISDIKQGSVEISNQLIDLDDLETAYQREIDKQLLQQSGSSDSESEGGDSGEAVEGEEFGGF